MTIALNRSDAGLLLATAIGARASAPLSTCERAGCYVAAERVHYESARF